MKMYPQLTREYIRDGISYVNLVMLQNVIPPYRKSDGKTSSITEKERKHREKRKPRHIEEILSEWQQ
jgi:hypothetical protein